MNRSSPAPKAPNAYHHGDLREALIDAATREIESNGAEAVSFSALAKTLGVSQAAPYRHFADREALLAAVATRAFRTFGSSFRKTVARRSSKSRLARIAHAYLDFGLSHVELYRLMYASRLIERAPVGSELYTAADANFDLVLEAIDPALDDLTRRRFALRFWTSLHGVVMLAEKGLLPPKIRKISIADVLDDLVRDTELAIAAKLADCSSQ
ncbi:MAG TPA: TetR/AcrR family transcriptional regulator [Parvibaculum sp.]|uniref:TetR/AcrR family transcriptional regulator n=1 Tax=Parvibaculum sp. TaxID=2024848 RepID=UPI002B5479B4|nr:TetR/AcrR family transcriptional regulator [Parvibaculum sp.]HMM13471.1 TetR/AcrR family transcriptional regulator [Parvibaculum sp.]